MLSFFSIVFIVVYFVLKTLVKHFIQFPIAILTKESVYQNKNKISYRINFKDRNY